MASVLICLASCTGTPSASSADDGPIRPEPSATRSPARPATPAATPPAAACLERLDAAVALAERGDTGRARLYLERLATRCEHIPQIHHDLGVIAARGDRLPAALAHFEAALESDPRVAMTLDHLRALNRREAALAYARALGQPGDTSHPPLAFQDSNDVGADTLLAERIGDDPARRVETLEYELYAWWRSAVDGDVGARLDHYVEGFPRADALATRERDATLAWDDVSREIAFTAKDAVVVIDGASETTRGRSESGPGSKPEPGEPGTGESGETDASGESGDGDVLRRLLLLRLEGDRWRIYRESPL